MKTKLHIPEHAFNDRQSGETYLIEQAISFIENSANPDMTNVIGLAPQAVISAMRLDVVSVFEELKKHGVTGACKGFDEYLSTARMRILEKNQDEQALLF